MGLGLFHFQLLHSVLERIHFIYDEVELSEMVLQSISSALNAEGGTLFRLQPQGDLLPIACYGVNLEKLKQMHFETGAGVVGWVAQHGQPIKVDRPGQDQRFTGNIDVITGFKTKTIIAAPILAKGRVVGVVEFLNRKDGPFSAPDLELVSMLGREVGIAFENVSLIRDIQRTRALLEAMTDSISAGIIVVDRESNFLRINKSALKLLGIKDSEEKWLGKPSVKLFSEGTPFADALYKSVQSANPIPRQEFTLPAPGGARVIGYSSSPVKDKAGERLGSALLFQDITNFVKKPA